MTRSGYFLFNVLLILMVYGLVYLGGATHEVLLYTVKYFSAPYVAVNFIMAIYALVRWFLSQDHDISREGITFLHATWMIALATFAVYMLLSKSSITHVFSAFK